MRVSTKANQRLSKIAQGKTDHQKTRPKIATEISREIWVDHHSKILTYEGAGVKDSLITGIDRDQHDNIEYILDDNVAVLKTMTMTNLLFC